MYCVRIFFFVRECVRKSESGEMKREGKGNKHCCRLGGRSPWITPKLFYVCREAHHSTPFKYLPRSKGSDFAQTWVPMFGFQREPKVSGGLGGNKEVDVFESSLQAFGRKHAS